MNEVSKPHQRTLPCHELPHSFLTRLLKKEKQPHFHSFIRYIIKLLEDFLCQLVWKVGNSKDYNPLFIFLPGFSWREFSIPNIPALPELGAGSTKTHPWAKLSPPRACPELCSCLTFGSKPQGLTNIHPQLNLSPSQPPNIQPQLFPGVQSGRMQSFGPAPAHLSNPALSRPSTQLHNLSALLDKESFWKKNDTLKSITSPCKLGR